MTQPEEPTADIRPGVGRGIKVLAWINVATVLVSVISFAAELDVLTLLFPQAAVFFPMAWEWNDFYGQVGLWFTFIGVAALVAGITALVTPRGYRRVRVFRAVTICGFVVACIPIVVLGGLTAVTTLF
ncbi:hypothetical protein [Microbacterium dauci]|uniref:Amino acid transporter n=1 Tax=Microbacterium dauci TaxID=3048008 RepID=A0ABT6ZFX8_9MICO|nr:hypothetical protein [Microbacterium sp. LX3-4]MDJ1115057.1 hypothetical protein [Microbacterium sp. LX3-4]